MVMTKEYNANDLHEASDCNEFDYQLLGRLQQDCEYYLGFGARNKKHLWALDEAEQIQKMKALYAGLPEKPEWITLSDIEKYEAAMVTDTCPGTQAIATVVDYGARSVIYSVGSVLGKERKDFTDVWKAVAAFCDAKAEDRPYMIRSECLPDGRESASIPGSTTYVEKAGHREYCKWIGGNDDALNSAWRETFISHDEMFSFMVQAGIDASFDAAKEAVSKLSAEDCFAIARADGKARLEAVERALAGQNVAGSPLKSKVYTWTLTEALEQAEAALPDFAFADRYGLDKNLIHRIAEINDRARKGPVPDSEVLPVLKEAIAALPAAWQEHGGVSKELADSLESTIRKAEATLILKSLRPSTDGAFEATL